MVRRSTTTTRFGGAPQAFQTRTRVERGTGKIIDVRTFRGTVRGGITTRRTGAQIRQEQLRRQQSEIRRGQVRRQSVVFKPSKVDLPDVSKITFSPAAVSLGITATSSAAIAKKLRDLAKKTGKSAVQVSRERQEVLDQVNALKRQQVISQELSKDQAKLLSEQKNLGNIQRVLSSKEFLTEADVVLFDSQVKKFEGGKAKFEAAVRKSNKEFETLERLAKTGLLAAQAGRLSKAKIERKRLEKQAKELGVEFKELGRRGEIITGKEKAKFKLAVGKVSKEGGVQEVSKGKLESLKLAGKPTSILFAAPTKKELIEKEKFPISDVAPTFEEFKKTVIGTGKRFEEFAPETKPFLPSRISALRPFSESELIGEIGRKTVLQGIGKKEVFGAVGRAVAGVGEFFETGLRAVGFAAEKTLTSFERATGAPTEIKIKVPTGTAKLIRGARNIPVLGEVFKLTEVSTVKGQAGTSELTLRKQTIVKAAQTAAEIELLTAGAGTRFAVGKIASKSKAGLGSIIRKTKFKTRSLLGIPQRGEIRIPSGVIEAARKKRELELFQKVPFPEELELTTKERQFRKLFALTPSPSKLAERVLIKSVKPLKIKEGIIQLPSGEIIVGKIPTKIKKIKKVLEKTQFKRKIPELVTTIKGEVLFIDRKKAGRDFQLFLKDQRAQIPRGRTVQLQKERPEFEAEGFFKRLKPSTFDDTEGLLEPKALEKIGSRFLSRFDETEKLLPKKKLRVFTVLKPKFEVRTDTKQLTKSLESLKEFQGLKDLSSLKEFQRLKQKQLSEVRFTTLSRLASAQALKSASAQAEQLKSASKVAERLKTTKKILTKTFARPLTKITTKPKEITKPRKPITKVPPPVIPLKDKDVGEEKGKRVAGFHAFVKEEPFKTSKFKRVSKKPLPLANAEERTFKVADNTISQTTEARPTKTSVPAQPPPKKSLREKFRSVKVSGKKTRFIEKRGFAIDTRGEKEKLKVSAFLAREKKRSKGLPTRKAKGFSKGKGLQGRKRKGGFL